MVNNEKGKQVIAGIKSEILIEERELAEATRVNTQIKKPSIRPKQRDKAYSYIYGHTLKQIHTHFFNTAYMRFHRFVGNILRALNIIKGWDIKKMC